MFFDITLTRTLSRKDAVEPKTTGCRTIVVHPHVFTGAPFGLARASQQIIKGSFTCCICSSATAASLTD